MPAPATSTVQLEGVRVMNGASVSGIIASLDYEKTDYQLSESAQQTTHASSQEHKSVVCSNCGAVYHQDRWTWDARAEDSFETLCPACLRVRDRVPAAILTIRGDCLTEHKNEIMRLIRNKIQKVGKQHPLKRIMDMEDDGTEAVFTFTDEQMTREIGDALHKAFDGVLDFQYSNDDSMLRVVWQR